MRLLPDVLIVLSYLSIGQDDVSVATTPRPTYRTRGQLIWLYHHFTAFDLSSMVTAGLHVMGGNRCGWERLKRISTGDAIATHSRPWMAATPIAWAFERRVCVSNTDDLFVRPLPRLTEGIPVPLVNVHAFY